MTEELVIGDEGQAVVGDDLEILAAESFDEFYRRTYPGLVRALGATLADRDLGREAADEAMARAFPRWTELSAYENPGGWVYRVGLNWARSLRARLARRLPFREPSTVELGPITDPELERALEELNVASRSVVVCRYLLDWSIEQTATALSIAPGTVKSRLNRALGQLEVALRETPSTASLQPTIHPTDPPKDQR